MSSVGPHGRLQFTVAKWLDRAAGEGEVAEIFTELRTNWEDRASLIPDVSVYLNERIPTTPDGEVADEFWTPPDLAVEIAAPDESAHGLTIRAETLIALDVKT